MTKELIAKLRHKASCNAGFEDGAEYTEIANALEEAERKLDIAREALRLAGDEPNLDKAMKIADAALAQIGGDE